MFDVQSISEYQEWANCTAVYRGRGEFLGKCYVTYGLVDEACELYEALGDRERAKKELSDVAWYIVETAYEFNFDVEGLLEEAQQLKTQTKTFHMDEAIHQVIVPAGQICGLMKKHIRDDNNGFPLDRKTKIEFHLAYALCGFLNVCKLLGTSHLEVFNQNLEKLYSRKERDQLHGSGDDR